MKYFRDEEGSDLNKDKKGFLGKILNYFFSNQKFDKISDKIVYWWIQLDEKNNPIKEIAFDKFDESLWIAPINDERGIYTDSFITFENRKNDIEIEKKFKIVWDKFIKYNEK